MGQKTPEVPEYLEFLEYLISCFLGLCSLGYLAFVSWLPVFFPVLPCHLQKCLNTGTVVPADFAFKCGIAPIFMRLSITLS